MAKQIVVKYKMNTRATRKQQKYLESCAYDSRLDIIIRIILFLKGLFTMNTELMNKMLDQELDDKEVEVLRSRLKGLMAKKVPYVRETPKIGRNEPCTCGSGKKYKHCCGK